MKTLSLLTTILLSALLGSALIAKEEAKLAPGKLAEFTLGELIAGDQAALTQMTGKVVVLEYWGINCGPCIAAMPSFVDMDKRYGKKGVQVVGVHCQSATADVLKKTVAKLKIKFPVVNQGSVPDAHSFSGIPHTFVFNTTGDLVYSGHPSDDMEKVVRKEMTGVGATASTLAKPVGSTTSSSVPAAPLIPNRAWANAEGKIMDAALLSVDGGTGKFKSPNGQIFSYAISKLSQPDQDYIKKTAAQ